jgi:hypothetical protein
VAVCNSDCYLIVTNVGKRLAVRYVETQSRELNEEEVQEQCQVTIINKFEDVESLENNGDAKRKLKTITENTKFRPKKVSVIVTEAS